MKTSSTTTSPEQLTTPVDDEPFTCIEYHPDSPTSPSTELPASDLTPGSITIEDYAGPDLLGRFFESSKNSWRSV
jgi:hypothetical protein